MNTIQHYSKSLFFSLFLLLSIGNVWGENVYFIATEVNLSKTKVVATCSITFGATQGGNGSVSAKVGETAVTSGSTHEKGTTVVLTATPDPGYWLSGWYSDNQGNQKLVFATSATGYTHTVTLDDSQSVYAKFEKVPQNVKLDGNYGTHSWDNCEKPSSTTSNSYTWVVPNVSPQNNSEFCFKIDCNANQTIKPSDKDNVTYSGQTGVVTLGESGGQYNNFTLTTTSQCNLIFVLTYGAGIHVSVKEGVIYRLKSKTAHGIFFSNERSDAGQISFFATKDGTLCVQTRNNDGTWQDGTPLTLGLSADGIFTATMSANGKVENVQPYTGDLTVYNLDGNPRNYKSNHNNDGDQGKLVDFRDVSTTYYDHYHMEYIDGNTDLGATMGNHINTNIANTLEPHQASKCNVRYEYNSKTNHLSRTVIAESKKESKFLSIYGEGLKDTQNKPLKKEDPLTLTDGADWLYMADFQAIKGDDSAISAYLMATYNNQQSWILAADGQENGGNASYPILGASTKKGTYNIMLMYDYKTNRVTAGWKPQGNFEVENQYAIDANLLLTRKEDNDVAQITIKNDISKISNLQKVVLVMQFNRDKQTGESQYKFSLPFDCRIKDIYGLPYGYMNSWGIQRYNGAERARTGWFEQDRPTFWEWMNYNDTLRAGEGYSLTVDRGNVGVWYAEGEGAKYLFFPSMQTGFNITKLSADDATVTYPDQPCNINLQYPDDTTDIHHRDRRKYDSNWKLIGPKNYNNITIKSSDIAWNDDYYLSPNKLSFVYVWDEDKKVYEAQSTTNFVFRAFFSYFVQFAGTITWQQYTQSETMNAPRYAPQTTRKPAEFRIDLKDLNDNELDRTFVALSPIGTEGFDLNLDLTKIDVQHPMIYTISENTDYAGNTLSLNTDTVALVVKTGTGGSYTIALPNENNDYDVVLVDKFEQQVNVLTPEGYPIQVEPGITRNRFYLVFAPKTGTSQPDGPTTNLQKTATDTNVRKVLINGKIYIVRDNRLYDITGKILTR